MSPRPADLRLPKDLALTCRRLGLRLTKHVLVVSVARQQVRWYRCLAVAQAGSVRAVDDLRLHRIFRASTSRFGIGQVRDSNRTPLGLHRIARKIGAGWPVGTVFRARVPVGFTWKGLPAATIAHRILWLEGLEPAFNRGGQVDTRSRFIYIHGLADEPSLGRPASHGCVHLSADDLIPLYHQLPNESLVWITAGP
ncbi:MAG: L,D-transpeptidase [Verrucomicrobiales bacterium]|nr:L,D-transpeptidase [Verrucomicrobiales bacterium]